ncbi:MAG: sensor histidine kinase [Desulfomonilaceae bacterium]
MMRRRPRLATVLLTVNLLIFLLPLGGIAILRLYESELIRRTETELNVQGALVASIYRSELLRQIKSNESEHPLDPSLSDYGIKISPHNQRLTNPDEPWTPIEATLDIAKDHVHPRPPTAIKSETPADALAQLAAQYITPVLKSAQKTMLSGIKVTDYRGVVVTSTSGDIGMSISNQHEVQRALEGEHVSLLRHRQPEELAGTFGSISRRSRVRVFVAMPVVEGDRVLGAVLLSRTPLDLSKALYQNRFYLIGGGAVILLVVCAVTVLTTLLVTRPVKALIHQAEQVTTSNKRVVAVPLTNPGTYEVDLLSKALAQMSATLEKRADYVRSFASNVSHELKTPLTSIRGTVELFKDHFAEMKLEDRDRFLNILEQDTDRLTRLVQRLLDLARAEVAQPRNDQAQVNEILDQVARRLHGEDLKVTVDCTPDLPPVAMGPEELESILSNLVENARQHGGPRVNVHISAHPKRDAKKDFVEIVIDDDGPGISAADADRIFKPFFTTAKQSGGTGLGLSIVQALVTAHRGSIALTESGSGARFCVLPPVNSDEEKI